MAVAPAGKAGAAPACSELFAGAPAPDPFVAECFAGPHCPGEPEPRMNSVEAELLKGAGRQVVSVPELLTPQEAMVAA